MEEYNGEQVLLFWFWWKVLHVLKLESIMYHMHTSYMYDECVAVRMHVFFYLITFLWVASL